MFRALRAVLSTHISKDGRAPIFRASKGKVDAFTTHPDLDTHHTCSYESETQTPLSCVPSTLVCLSPPPSEIPEINNPAIQLAGYLGSPSCHCAPHTAQAVSTDPAGRGQVAPPARGFLLRKTRCSRLRRFGFYVSELWAHPPHTYTHNRVGTTNRSEEGLRVVIATGA